MTLARHVAVDALCLLHDNWYRPSPPRFVIHNRWMTNDARAGSSTVARCRLWERRSAVRFLNDRFY
jgi:hypothetical protein